MFTNRMPLVMLAALSLTAAACGQPKEDPRVAELQKELDTARQQLAAGQQAAGDAAATAAGTAANAEAQAQAAAEAATTAARSASTAAENREAADRAASAAETATRDRAAAEQALAAQGSALAEQKAETARQAEENARLRREVEAMKPRQYTLAAGTVIPVRTTAALSTKSASDGSTFDGLLERDLVVDGTTIAKAGSRVSGIVASSDPGGRVKGVASLEVAARSITGVDGTAIQVTTNHFGVEAGSTKGRDLKRTGIATGAGALIGAIAGGGRGAAIGAGAGAAAGVGTSMATRGEPAVIPAETLIEFSLAAPATVVIRK